MKKFITMSCLMIVSAFLGLQSIAQAEEYKVDLIQLDPWAFNNPDAASKEPYVGIVVDLLKEFTNRSGNTTAQTLTPYIRVEQNLEKGEIDFSIMAWGDARAKYANKGTVFVPLDFGVRAKKGVSIATYDDLLNITTSATRGLKIDPKFDADTTLKKDFVLDYTMGVKKTAAEHGSQAVAGSLSTINFIIHKMNYQDKFGDTFVFRTTHLTVAYSKKSPKFADEAKVNTVFQAMVDDGTALKIYNKWMGL